MGSMVYLKLGNLEVDWGKNNSLRLHGALYQKGDITEVADHYVDDNDELFTAMQTGASKLLGQIVPRLELMGYTLASARSEFEELRKETGCEDVPITFDEIADALKRMDVEAAAIDYHSDYDYGKFFARHLFDRLGLGNNVDRADIGVRYDVGRLMENFDPYSVLRLLAENPANLSRPVTWHFHDVVENGWIDAKTVEDDIGSPRRFLIVTEGSSDSHILKHALKLLRPEIADFFTFVDMEEGYPFTGTGNLHRFCQGLVAIGIENQVVILYDNDLEGRLRCEETNRLALPPNMRVNRPGFRRHLAAINYGLSRGGNEREAIHR